MRNFRRSAWSSSTRIKERREAVIEEAEDDAEDAGQIGMEGVEDGE